MSCVIEKKLAGFSFFNHFSLWTDNGLFELFSILNQILKFGTDLEKWAQIWKGIIPNRRANGKYQWS